VEVSYILRCSGKRGKQMTFGEIWNDAVWSKVIGALFF
jgi:hypothetical protein